MHFLCDKLQHVKKGLTLFHVIFLRTGFFKNVSHLRLEMHLLFDLAFGYVSGRVVSVRVNILADMVHVVQVVTTRGRT